MKGLPMFVLGAVLFLGALTLWTYNYTEQKHAEEASKYAVKRIETLSKKQQVLPMTVEKTERLEMDEMEIDGEQYIGRLFIEDLGLELPVISQWSYERLYKAPCRYAGTVNGNDFVILAHNYIKHFAKIGTLPVGSEVKFEDIHNKTTTYSVVLIETVQPQDVEKVVSGEYDLTLLTCTYGGNSRTVVRCMRAETSQGTDR